MIIVRRTIGAEYPYRDMKMMTYGTIARILERKIIDIKGGNMTTKDIATVEMNPGAMIQMAVQGGADLDKLEKLMVLQERYEA